MSMYAMLLLIAGLISWDIKLIKRKEPILSHDLFQVPLWLSALVLVSGLLLFFADGGTRSFAEVFLIFYLPYYILKRRRILKAADEKADAVDANIPADSVTILLDLIGVILMFAFGSVVINLLTLPLTFLLPEFKSKLGELLLSLTLSYFLILWLIYEASRKFSNDGFWANLGFRTKNLPFFRTYVMPVLLGMFFAWISSHIIMTRAVHPQTPLEDILSSTQSSFLITLFIFFAVIGAPLVEEIMFRGYFFYALSRNMSKLAAISVVSLVFAVFHVGQYWGDWAAILVVTILGFALTSVRSLSQTTLASTIMHYVYNAGVTILPIIMLASSNASYVKYRMNFPNLDYPQKEQLLKESISANPKLAEAYNDLAWIYAEQSINLEEALSLIDRALAFEPQSEAFLDTKAEILWKLGKFEESMRICEEIKNRTNSEKMREIQDIRLRKIRDRVLN